MCMNILQITTTVCLQTGIIPYDSPLVTLSSVPSGYNVFYLIFLVEKGTYNLFHEKIKLVPSEN